MYFASYIQRHVHMSTHGLTHIHMHSHAYGYNLPKKITGRAEYKKKSLDTEILDGSKLFHLLFFIC